MATPIWGIEGVALGTSGAPVADSLAAVVQTIEGNIAPTEHIVKFGGDLWFVSAAGDDAHDGESPGTAFLTWQNAIDTAAAGDAITVMQGAYDEAVTINKVGLEIWCEIGTTLTNSGAGAAVVTISANSCRLRGELVITPGAGDTGVHVTANAVVIEMVNTVTGAVGFRLAGVGAKITDSGSFQPTTTAFWIEGDRTRVFDCRTTGASTATRGFWINNGADFARLENCESTGHGTAGFDIATGSTYYVVADSRSGAGDGDRVDDGELGLWSNFSERLETEFHEEIYPVSDGAGTAGDPIAISNATTDDAAGTRDDENYWGDTAIVIPPAALIMPWWSQGIYIAATTATDIQQFQCLYTRPAYSSAQDGGNDWDHTEVDLTVADGTIFEADDLVWITGNDLPAGEIQKVVSIAGAVVTVVSEIRASGGLGLRYDYDTDDSANTMFLVYRVTDRRFHATNGEYSASGAREHSRYLWETPRRIMPNGAMIMRMLNATDAGVSSFDVRAIYME